MFKVEGLFSKKEKEDIDDLDEPETKKLFMKQFSSINQSIFQSINQSIFQSINQSLNSSITQQSNEVGNTLKNQMISHISEKISIRKSFFSQSIIRKIDQLP